jgi:RNA polymerase sigma-70 factor, ECF subfamily
MSAAFPKERDEDRTACFDTLYAAHHRVVYAYLFGHLGNADSAADLLQETFLRVWRHLDDARQVPAERQRFWLFAIARNLLLDHRRRQAARSRLEVNLQERIAIQPANGDPAQTLFARETAAAVDAAIAALPEDLRLVLTLHLMGEMTSAEIGQSLNRPAGTIRYQLSIARQRIAQALKLGNENTDRGEANAT